MTPVTRVRICVELDEEVHRRFQREAEREGVTVESLLEKVVDGLLKEMEKEEAEGIDHPIIPS